MGGSDPSTVDIIDYVTIAQTGNSVDFGNLTGSKESGFNVLLVVLHGLYEWFNSPGK